MSTGDRIVEFAPARIWGALDLETFWLDVVMNRHKLSARDTWGDTAGGEGGVFTAAPTITESSDELSLSADFVGYTPDGYRLDVESTDTWWQGVPFQNTGGTTYTLGARRTTRKNGTTEAGDGGPIWYTVEDVVGRPIEAVSAADEGSGTRLIVTGNLWAGEKWPDTADTREVDVWYEDADGHPVTNSSEATAFGATLTRSAGGGGEPASGEFYIDIAHRFGLASTDTANPTRYKIVLKGPTPADPTNAATSDFTDYHTNLGTMLNGTHTNTSVVVLTSIGQFESAFQVEHNPTTGVHTDITAQSAAITSSASGNDNTALLKLERNGGTDKVYVIPGGTGAGEGGELRFPNVDDASDNTAKIRADTASGDSILEIVNGGAGDACIIVHDGILRTNLVDDWALECNDASLQTLYVRNTGSGLANIDVAGRAYVDGLSVKRDATSNYSIAYEDSGGYPTFKYDISPYNGGWTVTYKLSGTSTGNVSPTTGVDSDGKYMQCDTADEDLILRLPIPHFGWGYDDTNTPASKVVYAEMEIKYFRSTSSTLSVELRTAAKGSAAGHTAHLSPSTSTAGSVQTTSDTSAAFHGDTNHGWVEIHIRGDTLAANCRLYDVHLWLEKRAVE